MKKQNILAGAVILAISNTVSKILGAIFKIPLTYIIDEEGMAIYNSAINIYIMFLSFVVSGLPFAVSKLVSEYSSLKKYSMVRHTVKTVNILLICLGALGSLILYLGADFFAIAIKEEKAVFAIKMISPAILFVAMGATIRSYYQGLSNMIPTAISQIIESVTKLFAGYFLAKNLIHIGLEAATGGAVFGITLGEAVATAVFMVVFLFSKKEKYICTIEEKKCVYDSITQIAVPLLFSAVISSMLSVVDTTVIRAGLVKNGMSIDYARKIYGAYTGYAMTVFHLPVGILGTLGVTLLPVISGAFAINDIKKAELATNTAIKITMIISLPCSVIMYFMSNYILKILFGNIGSSNMLIAVSPFLSIICLGNILTSIIQAAGKIIPVFIYSTADLILKIILSVLLMPTLGIFGTILSGGITSILFLFVSIIITRCQLGLKFKILDTIIKPCISVIVMILIIYLIKEPIQNKINSEFMQLIIITAFSGVGYIMSIIITGALKNELKITHLKTSKKYDIMFL